jgi:nitroreductase/dihydropteridine reductase
MEKQVYLNLGALLTSAAIMGVDALPMEGFDFPALDAEFDLRGQNLAPVAVVALGYRAETDFNATLPKSRFTAEQIFTQI